MNFKLAFWKSSCPVCGLEKNIHIFDRGKKFWLRLFALNNRFACRKCKVTWRRKAPKEYVKYASSQPKNDNNSIYTIVQKRPARPFKFSLTISKKSIILYCFVGILGLGVAYSINQFFFSNYQKLKLKPKVEMQSTNDQGGSLMNGRNDKYAGKKEIQNLKSAKKSW